MRSGAREREEASLPALDVRGLSVPFGRNLGLSDVSFRVERGERLVLVGGSGVGKTSLLGALAGSGSISAGRIQVEGREVTNQPPEKRGVVLLSQRPLLFPHLSVFENVAFPLRVSDVPRGEVSGRVEGALAAVRMAEFGPRSPQGLSGGQAHRVALARAVVSRPPVLLLDEPLTSLDPALREEVRRSILAVHEEYGPALLWVTHDLQEAGRMADRVGVILDGGLAQLSSPGELFRAPGSPAVARFLGLPNEVRGILSADGTLRVHGWAGSVEGFGTGGPSVPVMDRDSSENAEAVDRPFPHGGIGKTEVVVVFGVDAGRILPSGSGGVPARIKEVLHHPQGATAQVEFLDPGESDSDYEANRFGEVSVDPVCFPEPGSLLEVGFVPNRMHVFPVDAMDEGTNPRGKS